MIDIEAIGWAVVDAASKEWLSVVRDTDDERPRPTIRQGSRGEHVRALQRSLAIPVSGSFDVFTGAAVRDFQRAMGLAVDGVVGRDTWTAAGAYLAGGYPGDIETITEYIAGNGWQGWLDRYGAGKYTEKYTDEHGEERTMKWCGHFVGAMLRRVAGELDGHSVDIRAGVVRYCLPSCARMASAAKWREAKLPQPENIDIWRARPGDIATVGHGKDGSHIVLIAGATSSAGSVDTLEGNAWGTLGDGTQGEGVVRNRRQWQEFRRVYRLGFAHFKGASVAK